MSATRPCAVTGKRWRPVPLCAVTLECVEDVAHMVGDMIGTIERARGCGAYLFVSPARQVYVLSEERTVAGEWLRFRAEWLVGYYRTVGSRKKRRPGARPEEIAGDLLAHMAAPANNARA